MTNIPLARAPAAGRDQRGGGRQAERARARDDQHGEPGAERVLGGGAGQQPARQGGDGAGQHGGDEHAADPVGQPLDGGLLRLCLLDQPDQLRQLGIAPDVDRADDEPAGEHDGSAGHAVAFGRLARHRFPGHHAPVDGGLAELDLPVRGDGLTRPDDEPVSRSQLAGGDLALGPSGSSRQTSLAAASARSRIAWPAMRLARASYSRPASRNVVTVAAVSR